MPFQEIWAILALNFYRLVFFNENTFLFKSSDVIRKNESKEIRNANLFTFIPHHFVKLSFGKFTFQKSFKPISVR